MYPCNNICICKCKQIIQFYSPDTGVALTNNVNENTVNNKMTVQDFIVSVSVW